MTQSPKYLSRQPTQPNLLHRQGQTIPSSYAKNSEYFNVRLIRIKQKIDEIIRENLSSTKQHHISINEVKTEITNEDRSSNQTINSHQTTYARVRQQLPIEKIVGVLRQNIKNIYNQIHQLESAAGKDQDLVNTNTFELRSFLKDLRNQYKRLTRILPQSILLQLQKKKKQPVIKSKLATLSTQKTQTQSRFNEKEQLLLVNKLIEQQFRRRRIFKDQTDQEKSIYDKQTLANNKSTWCECQVI